MLRPVKTESLHVEGVFQADLVFGSFPTAVVTLEAGPVFEPRQIHVVQARVVGKLTTVKFSPAHEHGARVVEPHPILKQFDGFVEQRRIFDVVLDNAGELGAERADFGVKLGSNELAEVVDDLEVLVELHGANLNDFDLSRLPAAPACGLQIVDNELTFAHRLQR